MPVHDWSQVDAGIFHAFHHDWITEISRAFNGGILPPPFYALPEQVAAGFNPDVLALQRRVDESSHAEHPALGDSGSVALLDAPPKVRQTVEADIDFYRRKQSRLAIRHVSGHTLVAVVEIVSPGNKSSRGALREFVEKAVDLLERGIHMLIIDLQPRTVRDPQGIHGAVWEELTGQEYLAPADEPLTLLAYESGPAVRAYVEPLRVGSVLAAMPLYLEPRGYVLTPLEETYSAAFAGMPQFWREVLNKETII